MTTESQEEHPLEREQCDSLELEQCLHVNGPIWPTLVTTSYLEEHSLWCTSSVLTGQRRNEVPAVLLSSMLGGLRRPKEGRRQNEGSFTVICRHKDPWEFRQALASRTSRDPST